MKIEPCTEDRKGMIKLGEGYYFMADENQYILYRIGRRTKIDRKTRKETNEMIEFEDIIGYYPSLKGLIKACISYEIKQDISLGMAKSLNDVLERLNSFEKYLVKITKGY